MCATGSPSTKVGGGGRNKVGSGGGFTVGAFGGIDVLVNNAGGAVREGTLEERWEGSFDLNVMSVVRLMELAKAHLAESAQSGGGAVVNIASIFGREFGPPPWLEPFTLRTRLGCAAWWRTYSNTPPLHWIRPRKR